MFRYRNEFVEVFRLQIFEIDRILYILQVTLVTGKYYATIRNISAGLRIKYNRIINRNLTNYTS